MPRFEVGFVYTVESSVIVEAKNSADAAKIAEGQFNQCLDRPDDDIIMELTDDATLVFEVLGVEPVSYCS